MPPRAKKKDTKSYQVPNAKGNTRSRAVRGTKGILQELPKLPLDIVYEILSRCSPLDLLRLARTTKAFRALLMSRSSIVIWRSARQLSSDIQVIGMPECPPFLSEPAYANLAFDSYCHSCLANNIHRIIWEFRKRYCFKCAKFTMISTFETRPKTVGLPIAEEWGENLHRVYKDNNKYYSAEYYHKPELLEFKNSMASMTTTEEREIFMQRERNFTVLVAKHAKLLRKWSESRPSRSDEILDTRERMIISQVFCLSINVIERLKLHGWGDELQYLGDNPKWALLQLPCLKQARDVTDRIWMNIELAILKYMEDCKTARLDRARQALLVTRFRIMEQVIATPLLELSKTTPVPRVIDICLTNQARSILDVPSDRTLTAADLAPLIPLLPALTQSWYAKIESQYIQHVSSNERTTPSGSVLELVTSCKRCKHVLFFPDSLTHVCHNLPRARRKEDQPKGKAKRMTWQERQDFNLGVDLIRRLPVYERATRDLSACVPWSCDQDSIEREDGVVRGIIEACGKSSDEVTCKEMDDSDARLLCDMCSQDGRLLVVTWRSAVYHAFESHKENIPKSGKRSKNLTWTLLVDNYATAKAKILEYNVDFSPNDDDDDDLVYCCCLCEHEFTVPIPGYYRPTKQDIYKHLSS